MDLQKLTEWVALLERRIEEQEENIEALVGIVESQLEIIEDLQGE